MYMSRYTLHKQTMHILMCGFSSQKNPLTYVCVFRNECTSTRYKICMCATLKYIYILYIYMNLILREIYM